ncbi:MAG: flagellar assembly protein FliW [Arcobacter sp.]|jgi:flagellar assembly factor FliW|uniref:flagellar assembly protein FliW n=1 Tax=Arcobacter sp. TaxID=1872629 RepID=UPI002587217F|nr:flagellar assembly protein FliW [Arcobacter sp.]MDD3007640.1 flagellar assembly protein FliW [Arcobacter sp.]MDY3205319.1 flagellar assembly protein FliW [Arcobacter sp.]
MYKVVLPILGFESFQSLSVEKIDDFASFLVFDEKTKIAVVNIKYLTKVKFDFEIDKDVLEKMNIKSQEDFDIYFCVVSQEPVENSILNLISPIFINEKDKLIGQYVTIEKVDPLFASIKECAKL